MRGKFFIKGNRSFFNLIGILVGLIFFVGLLLAFFQRNQNNNARHLIATYERLKDMEERIEEYFHGTSSSLLSLTFAVDKRTGAVENFDSIASQVLETNKKIDMLSLLPGGTIDYVYPRAGNEGLIGKNILNSDDYNIKVDAFETQRSKQLKFSGPFKNFAGDS